jgi:hypothetical protein
MNWPDLIFQYRGRTAHIPNPNAERSPNLRPLCNSSLFCETADSLHARVNRGWWRLCPRSLRKDYFDSHYFSPVCQHCFRLYFHLHLPD